MQMRLVEEGAVRPLVELVHFPDAAVQACSAIAINAVAIGTPHHNNLHHSGRRLNHSSAAAKWEEMRTMPSCMVEREAKPHFCLSW
jgi:hypothetical protein